MNFDNAMDVYKERYGRNPNSTAPQFCREVTFQVTERCNLACTYCVEGDTLITMVDGSKKPIKDIKIGDVVLGFDEYSEKHKQKKLRAAVVEKVFCHQKRDDEQVYDLRTEYGNLIITGNHKLPYRGNLYLKASSVSTATNLRACPINITKIADSPNYDLGYFIGVMVGDGSYNAYHYDDRGNGLMYIVQPKIQRKQFQYLNKSYICNNAVYSNTPIDFEGNLYNIQTSTRTYIANNVLVHNCYQIHKTPKVMPWEVAKAGVDLLFNMWIENEPDAFINQKTEFIILDFIGGEPMLEVKLIDRICDYFINQALEINPLWAETFMISMASNGTIYFTPEVQHFLHKWDKRLSYSVSMDGPKEMHDACRIFPDGRGSFDLAKAAQDDYNKTHRAQSGTKATISWQNMPYLDTTIKYYVDQGYRRIHANTVYEEDWTPEQGAFFYKKLKEVADFMLSLDGKVEISLFDKNFFKPRTDMEQTWCGGYDSMLAFDPDGNAFPCIRYMESSLGGQMPPVIIGDVWNGLWKTPEQKHCHDCLACITWTTQNDEECLNCPIAQGCADCAAESYQHMKCFNKRHKLGSCWVHRARSLANVYYWNKLWRQQGSTERFKRYLPDDIALQIVSKEELEYLNSLEEA